MNGKIVFNEETQRVMIALLLFVELENRSPRTLNHHETMTNFKKYIDKNKLESESIKMCKCKCSITNRETITNVCLHCKGIVHHYPLL